MPHISVLFPRAYLCVHAGMAEGTTTMVRSIGAPGGRRAQSAANHFFHPHLVRVQASDARLVEML
jgi:hypothetical protein